MGKKTGIAWVRSSRNAWTGCRKIGPGCDGCYAEAQNRFYRGKNQATGEANNWGDGARIQHLEGFATDLRRWNRQAGKEREAGIRWEDAPDMPAGYWPVFVNSQSDTFDNDAPQEWRNVVWQMIEECRNLEFLLVTKRIGNVGKMIPIDWAASFPPNVRLLITVVNQEEADRDIPKLLALPCKNGISYEPALSSVDWRPFLAANDLHKIDGGPRLDWIIVGGESNQGSHRARPFNVEWASSTVRQCKAAGVPVFMKQAGSFVIDRNDAGFEGDGGDFWPAGTADKLVWNPFGYSDEAQGSPVRIRLDDRAGADPIEWPVDLRVAEFPQ